MKNVLGAVMVANAALFAIGALLHAGIGIGPFAEPRIAPATFVETICGLFLLWGAISLFANAKNRRQAALTGNLVALGGVSLGLVALAFGNHAGPRTPDPLHPVMLALIAAGLVLLYADRPKPSMNTPAHSGG